jgi:CBS domain-containing protein
MAAYLQDGTAGNSTPEETMKVSTIMTKDARTILPDATVEQAARLMRDHRVGLLPVVENETLFGIITDRDLAIRALADGRNPHLTTVREVMTPEALWCYEDESITEASRIMEKHHVRRLIIKNRQHKLSGVLTITDLARRAANEKLPGHVLHRVAESSK